jgi:predicted SAM-dependent methyltransferase
MPLPQIKLSLLDRLFQSKSQFKIDQWLISRRAKSEKGINIGCGNHPIDGLINVDKFSPYADIKIDFSQLESAFDKNVDHIEAHHVIEHLSFSQVNEFIKICFNILSNNKIGTLVITCPDMNKVCKKFLANDVVESPKEDRIPYVWKMIYGSQEHEGMFHRSGFTEKSLESLLRKIGFEIMLKHSPFPNRSTPSICVIAVKNEK